MKSYIPSAEEVEKKWHVVDASGQTLGRLASRVARLLTGKDKVIYTPFLDTGDHVIVVGTPKSCSPKPWLVCSRRVNWAEP